jgi:AcrR family transcriptional regulator
MHSDGVEPEEMNAENSGSRQSLPRARSRIPGAGHPVSGQIVAVARRNFFANGFRGVTMDDLAQDLGISKKTLYEHFPSKTALVEAAIFDKFRGIDAEMERITSECSSDFAGTLHRLLAYIQQQTEEIQPPFLRDIRRQPEIFHHVENRRTELVQRYFGKLIYQGRAAGIVRKDVPAELITEIILGALEKIINPAKMAELEITPKAGYSAIIAVILEGVITEKGRSNL